MDYMAVSELKHSKNLWTRLSKDREVVLTRDGKPGALMLGVTPESLETVVRAVRQALFSEAVSNIRRRTASEAIPNEAEIQAEIEAARS
jgi:hypothetical protein